MRAIRSAVFLSLATAASSPVHAEPVVTIDASVDVWIRETSPSTTYEDDLVSVWSSESPDDGRRYGVVEFDLSEVEPRGIQGASLRLWAGNFDLGDDLDPIRQSAAAIDTSGGTPASSMTWESYVEEHDPVEPFAGLGRVELVPAGVEDLDRYVEGAALEAELDAVREAARRDPPVLTLLLIADEGQLHAKSWGDGADGFGGFDPQLVLSLDPVFVFADGFESGDLVSWNCSQVGGAGGAVARPRGGVGCDF